MKTCLVENSATSVFPPLKLFYTIVTSRLSLITFSLLPMLALALPAFAGSAATGQLDENFFDNTALTPEVNAKKIIFKPTISAAYLRQIS